jgi:GT2 family glycosyltransferase
MSLIIHKIRSIFLSPNSSIELFFRTIYHKIATTRLFFLWQNHLARKSYRNYRLQQKQNRLPDSENISHKPKITFLVSCLESPVEDIHTTLQSIISLDDGNWEVLLFADKISSNSILGIIDEPRIRSSQQDTLLQDQITGEYVIFCEAGDKFFPSLLTYFYESITESPLADLTYFDCEYYRDKSGDAHPFFKPKAPSPEFLLSVNYFSRGFIRLETLNSMWTEIASYTNLLSKEYGIALNLCEINEVLRHLPHILISQKQLSTPEMPENRHAIVNHLTRKGLTAVKSTKLENGYRFSWFPGDPNVSIIILTKNHCTFLEPLLSSIMTQTAEISTSIHIVDNGSQDPATLKYYQQIQEEYNISIIPYNEPFNYSDAINLGAASTDSDLLLFMNDDMLIKNSEWLSELTQWAIRPEIGVVGAKLLRKNHTIQHAGIILGLTGFMGHLYLNAPEHYNGLFGSVDWYRNYLAVTGALQMVRREVFEEVGGYDPKYQLAFGDIDFCVRVHERGYQNVYTPFAQLYHYEGSSRGYDTPVQDVLRGYEKMGKYLVEQDPYFSPNLTYTRIPKCQIKKETKEMRQQQIEERKKFYTRDGLIS